MANAMVIGNCIIPMAFKRLPMGYRNPKKTRRHHMERSY